MATLQSVKIFPSIGIARIGNSPEWFVGPELPFPASPPVPPDGKYKDAQCRIRRQAQRFRLWGYFSDGTNREVTAADGNIQWTVHLANKKAAFRGEAGGLIDPGPRTLNGPNDTATFANGTFTYSGQTVEVPLGNALTDNDGRLIVVGGFGFSSTPVSNNPLTWWLTNAGWHDDISDGPVNATITVGNQTLTAAGAWVICPPPRYAPGTYSVITLYDTLREIAIEQNLLPQPGQPSFVKDIWPILTRALGMLRVTAATFGAGDHSSLQTVIPPGAGQDATRQAIFAMLANPTPPPTGGSMPLLNAGGTMPTLNEADIPPALRKFQYAQMQAWSQGNFVNDWPPAVPTTITPDGLTQAALENCVGAPFYPGIEATVTLRDGSIKYTEAFRFDQTNLSPGDVTQAMARPWQSDFTACTGGNVPDGPGWWPAARPDSVYPQGSTTYADWTRGLITSAQDMVDNWYRLGFIVDPGNGQAVETERMVVCKDCFIVTDRSSIGMEEAKALIQANEQAVDAFFVIVEGFVPQDLGITTGTPSPAQLQQWTPTITLSPVPTALTALPHSLLLENAGALNQVQRVTFGFNLKFTDVTDFTADVVPILISAQISGVFSSAPFYLTKKVDPYMVDGAISWLSNDTRVFKLQPGGSFAGVTLGNDPLAFIQSVITLLQTQNTQAQRTQNYQLFESLDPTENGSQLEWLPTLNNAPVYNFALARVRYRATVTSAVDIRVFFRMFQTAATGTDFNPNTTYRTGGQPGSPIPVLGIQGGELVTIPFFAEARKPATVSLNLQTDDTNKHTIVPEQNGQEVYAYFGCWLDINNPNDLRFPIQPAPPDGGPFTGQLKSIADLIRGTHQCLVAEVYVPGEALTPGVTPASSDKLSQRNLAIDHSDNPGGPETHRVQHTFAIHPTPAALAPKQRPDELMIQWGNTPAGCVATLYLPGVRSAEILALAGKLFNLQTLMAVDEHTIRCHTGGVTYVPIPTSGPLDLAGLVTIDLPVGIRAGQTFRVVVRQVTDTPGTLQRVATPTAASLETAVRRLTRRRETKLHSRHILGAFQFSVQVKVGAQMLPTDERTLRSLHRVIATIPAENRWYPVLQRYIKQLTTRVHGLGGTPPGDGGYPGTGPCGPGVTGHHPSPETLTGVQGKIVGLIFDRFGDFDGFWLDTEDGRRSFSSREREMERLVRTAWDQRIPVRVETDHDEPHRVRRLILLHPPAPL